MSFFDWNGNGESDSFDTFMDLEAMSASSNDRDNYDNETTENIDDTEVFDDDLTINKEDGDDLKIEHEYSRISRSRREHTKTRYNEPFTMSTNDKQNNTSFQDELKKNMRTPEVVKREKDEKESKARMWEAERTLEKIKRYLIDNAKNANYTVQNGERRVSCLCDLNYRYLRTKRIDNTDQLKADNQRFILFRDSNLKYESWDIYDVDPRYRAEYDQFMSALKTLASKENIHIDSVIYNTNSQEEYPFPTKMRTTYSIYSLGLRASIIIPTNTSQNEEINPSETNEVLEKKEQHKKDDMPEHTQQDDNLTTIIKSFLVVALCVVAFAICLTGEVGKLGMAVIMIGAAIIGYHILKK